MNQINEWINQGLAATDQQNYQDAIRLLVQAKEGYAKMFDQNDENYAGILFLLAYNYSALGDYPKAVETGTQYMEILRSIHGDQHPKYAESLNDVAMYYHLLGDYSKAVKLFAQVLEIKRSVPGDKYSDYAKTLHNLANCYSKLGDYSKAVELCTQAMEIYRSILGEQHADYVTSLNSLAICYSSLGDYSKAVELGTHILEICRTTIGEWHSDYATFLNNLAGYYSDIGDNSKAVELGTRVLEIRRLVIGEHHSDYAISLNNLASYYYLLGDYSKARELGTQAMEIQRTIFGEKHLDYAISLSNLANYYSSLGLCSKAVELGAQAIVIFRSVLGEQHPDYAQSLNNLAGNYYVLGDYSNALKYFRQSISILQNNTLQQFANLTTSQRNLLWAKDSYAFTDAYPSFLFQSHTKTASDIYDKSALFAKGLLLSTEIEMNRLIQESGDEEALQMFNELQLNRLQLQKLYETPIAERHVNTDSLTQIVDRQEQALVRRSTVYGDFTRKLRTTWQDVQQALHPDEIAIEFLSFKVFRTDSTMVAALTLRKDDKEPKFIPLFEQRMLQSVSDTIYFHCPELTNFVWQPLKQELQGIKRIYFSPAGALHNIGIEYAPGMENYEMYRLSTTKEVIDTHPSPPQGRESATTTGPSFLKEEKGGTSTAALFGGIDYDTLPVSNTPSLRGGAGEVLGQGEASIALHRAFVDSLDIRGAKVKIRELPGTRTEVEKIKCSFDTKHRPSTLRMGAEATETAVKVLSGTKPDILHIATHGFYFTEKQAERQQRIHTLMGDGRQTAADTEDKALTRSGLLMAGANVLKDKDLPMEDDDGILTAQEISRLDLRGLDLVVLSACKTGNGDIKQGEGVFGLQRGFKKAGAQTLVMSLWEVADDATQILMTAFYDNLLQGQSKREAFHNAQRHLRTVDGGQYDHPWFWAAFILLDSSR